MTASQIPIGAPVVGSQGEPLGLIGAVYFDNATGRLAWAAVQGRRHTAVVPLAVSRFDGATLHVPYGADRLVSAPHHDPDTLISYAEGDDLARHYGLIPTSPVPSSDNAEPSPDRPARSEGRSGGGEIIRSEEQLRAGVVNVVVGRARLVTYVVTEDQTFTVPVSRQEVRLVYDAVPEHEQVVAHTAPEEETYEVILHSEQVLFSKQLVPIERVRMLRRVHTRAQTATEQVRAEQIEVEHSTADHTAADAGDQGQRAGDQPWD